MLLRACVEAVVHRAGMAHHGQRPKPLQRRRNEIGDGSGEGCEQAGQVVGVPLARHVRLAETDQSVAADPARQRVGIVHHHGGQRRIGRTDHRAVRILKPDRQARDCAAQEPVREPACGGAQRTTRHPRHCGPAVGIRCRAKVSGGMGGHSWSTLSFSSAGTRGTTGTRRRNSVMPWMRIHIAPINGASGATS